MRVSPGKLSVSRTIGDIEAKYPKFGVNLKVIISIPEIKYFGNTDKNDLFSFNVRIDKNINNNDKFNIYDEI